jgi:hypothetical protein
MAAAVMGKPRRTFADRAELHGTQRTTSGPSSGPPRATSTTWSALRLAAAWAARPSSGTPGQVAHGGAVGGHGTAPSLLLGVGAFTWSRRVLATLGLALAAWAA